MRKSRTHGTQELSHLVPMKYHCTVIIINLHKLGHDYLKKLDIYLMLLVEMNLTNTGKPRNFVYILNCLYTFYNKLKSLTYRSPYPAPQIIEER